jgi:tRNA modification GTPase
LGARIAEPGEFTKRAFLNDKIDLAQAESVADLIDASTAEAARSAMRSLAGEFSIEIDALVQAVIRLRMLVEAALDFPEEDVDFLAAADAIGQLDAIRVRLQRILAQASQGAILREGLQVVLIGQPNVGKSSLLNRLAGEEVVIVTPVPGTTRDSVRQQIEINGVPLHVIDTAGLRETNDEVERVGIDRTWTAIRKASVALLIVDLTRGVGQADRAILDQLPESLAVLTVGNKVDLLTDKLVPATLNEIRVSAKTGQGIDGLRSRLLEIAGWRPLGEGVFMARQRHLKALEAAQSHLGSAATESERLELFAEELRLAQIALSTITGEFTSDDLLGEIFSRFCIGK